MSPILVRLTRAFVGSLLLLAAATAVAYAADLGHKDQPYVNGGGGISGSKPESKLWFNDGLWWGDIWDDATQDFWIYQLNPATDSWVKTAARLDDRKGSRADTLWDGTSLYVASQAQSDSASSGSNPARLYKFSYDSGTKTYTNLAGGTNPFGIMRTGSKLETLVIAKDGVGTLWATWTQPSGSGRVAFTNHTIGGNDASWSTGVAIPVANTTTSSDDISSIVSFKLDATHNAVGVFWSNQATKRDYFAYHVDGAADTAWTEETALAPSAGNAAPADDHINLKADSSGRVYAVVKNSNDTSGEPEIELLRRPAGGGSWSESVVSTGNTHTRPIVLLDESANTIHVFLTGPTPPDTTGVSGGTIFEKTSSMGTISFVAGTGTARIRDDLSPRTNNPTSTKQNVSAASGIVVLASDDSDSSTPAGHRNYWHYRAGAGGGGGAPVADFTSDVVGGAPGVTVHFSDASTNTPLSWAWNFGDTTSGALNTSTSQNPSHQYLLAGSYTVSLTATNGSGPGSITKTNYIVVTSGGGGGTPITLTPDADTQVKVASSTNLGANIQLRTREENPVASSTYRSYLRFNVQGLTGTVNTVTLRLWVDTASTNTQTVFNTTTLPTWPELTTNGTNAPAIGSTVYGSSTASPAGAYKDITLLPSSIGGNGLVTFALKSSGTTSAYFSSKEGAHAPQLVITQTVVSSPPTADFSGTPTTGTPGTTVAFTDLSTNTPNGWDWDFGDGSVHGTIKNPSHVYPAVGNFTVILTASNGSGPSAPVSKPAYIKIGNAPAASFTATPTGGASPLSVHFNNTSDAGTGPTTWAWDFDGNGTVDDTTQSPTDHVYASGGTFTAKLTATSIFGASSATQSIVVTGPPTADFSGTPLVIHPNDSVQFTDLSTGSGPITWAWAFGDTGTSTSQNPSHQYTAVGTYTVDLTATNGAGSNTKTRTNYVSVGTAPVAAFAANPDNGTAPLNVNFANTSSGSGPLTYAWDFDNNGTVDSTTATPSHVFAAGSYTVKLTVSSAFGTDSITHPVTATGGSSTTTPFNAVADAHVKSASQNTNYGTLATLQVRADPVTPNDYKPYLKFTVTGLSGTVTNVKLRLTNTAASNSANRDVCIYGVTNTSWIESGTGSITWATAPLAGPSIVCVHGNQAVGAIDYDLGVPFSGNGTYSYAVFQTTSSSVIYSSKEGANPPQLVVTTGP